MNRQQRRKAQKQLPKHAKLTPEQRTAALYKNGITVKDLEKNYDIGWHEGWHAAVQHTFKTCYAAFILAMRRQHRFGRFRCKRILKQADENVLNALTTEELIDQVWEEIGLQLDFKDSLDRIKEVEK